MRDTSRKSIILSISLRRGKDEDLIKWLTSMPEQNRSAIIRSALRMLREGPLPPAIPHPEPSEPAPSPQRPAGAEAVARIFKSLQQK